MSTQGPATFKAYYNEPYNAVVQPHRFLYYFRQRWMRELGPVGTSIVLYLRGLCYHNRDKGELRDSCECKLEDIAEAIGVSRPTVAREMSVCPADVPSKGKKKGDFVNDALQEFVARQAQYDLTEQGVRRATSLYHVSMDDPIHPDDQALYELLCKEYAARKVERGQPLKPVYKGETAAAQQSRKGSGSSPKRPESQFETKAFGAPPESQFETNASESGREPESQFDTANDTYVCLPNVQTFNVLGGNKNIDRGESIPVGTPTADTVTNAPKDLTATLIERYVTEILRVTKDENSTRRYHQLVGICEKNNTLSVVDVAIKATEAAVEAGTVPKPGAYLQKIILTKLSDRGIHVPSKSETGSASRSIASTVRQSLAEGINTGQAASAQDATSEHRRTERGTASVSIPGHEASEIAALESEGGPEAEAWAAFVREKRHAYEEATKEMSPGLRIRSLAAFDSPDRRRSLWRSWQSERRGSKGN